MDQELTRYLNDHLAGSAGALLLIQELADSHDDPEAQVFFLQFKVKVEADRSLLEDLLVRIGQDPSAFIKMAGAIAARIGGIKLMWEQIEPGKLGLFEALEILALGVQGKCLLWVALREISTCFPEWNGIDFVRLEQMAIQQRDEIESWRICAGIDILADPERRFGMNHNAEYPSPKDHSHAMTG
jgi:hypothetical protein